MTRFALVGLLLVVLSRGGRRERFRSFESWEVLEQLPRMERREGYELSFLHIPKTGGTSMRWGLPKNYLKTFSWGREFTNTSCNVTRASRFHLTVEETLNCGVVPRGYWQKNFVVCTVRNPYERALSELRFNYHGNLTKYINACQLARPGVLHDTYAHCRAQVDFLYSPRGEAQCDLVLANPGSHRNFLKNLLNLTVPKNPVNTSPKVNVKAHTKLKLIAWLNRTRAFFDVHDPVIHQASQGRIVFPQTSKARSDLLDHGRLWLPLHLPSTTHRFNFNPYYNAEDEERKRRNKLLQRRKQHPVKNTTNHSRLRPRSSRSSSNQRGSTTTQQSAVAAKNVPLTRLRSRSRSNATQGPRFSRSPRHTPSTKSLPRRPPR